MSPPRSSSRNLYISALIATLTAAQFGYSVGVIGGLLVLPSFLSHFHLSNLSSSALAAAQARIVTIWLLGALFGVPLGIPLCARWGRRTCLAVSGGLYVLGAGLQVGGRGLVIFEIGRAVNGLGVGAGTLVGPIYISEISPPSQRGMLMSGYQTSLQLSALVGFWGAFAANSIFEDRSNLQWQTPVLIQLVPGAVLLFGAFLIPEAPRFLAEKARWQAAEKALKWLRRLPQDDPVLTEESLEIKEAVEAIQVLQAKQRKSFVQEAMTKPVRSRLGVGVGLMIAQNMVGLNALNYYAPIIFISAGFKSVSASLFLTGMFGLVKIISATAFMFCFVRIRGNRFWLKLGSAVCCGSMLVLGYFVRELSALPESDNSDLGFAGAVSVLMVFTFAFSFGVSLGPISWNVCAEIFPLHINAKCCAITTCSQWLFQIVIAGITPRLLASIGWATYLIYAIFCALTYTWVSLYVPETRGVALGRPMDELFDSSAKRDRGCVVEEVEEIDESTALLWRGRERERERRRSSVVGPV